MGSVKKKKPKMSKAQKNQFCIVCDNSDYTSGGLTLSEKSAIENAATIVQDRDATCVKVYKLVLVARVEKPQPEVLIVKVKSES
jgi:ketopantoate hydroxymethyltransferase